MIITTEFGPTLSHDLKENIVKNLDDKIKNQIFLMKKEKKETNKKAGLLVTGLASILLAIFSQGCTPSDSPTEPQNPVDENKSPEISKVWTDSNYRGAPLDIFYHVKDPEGDAVQSSILYKDGPLTNVEVYVEDDPHHIYTNSLLNDTGTATIEFEVKDTHNNKDIEQVEFDVEDREYHLIVQYDTTENLDIRLNQYLANQIGVGLMGGGQDYQDADTYEPATPNGSPDPTFYDTENSTERTNVANIINNLIDNGEFDSNADFINNPHDYQDKVQLLQDILDGNGHNYDSARISVTDNTVID